VIEIIDHHPIENPLTVEKSRIEMVFMLRTSSLILDDKEK